MIAHCWAIESDVVPAPVDHQPGREGREQEDEHQRQELHHLGLGRVGRLRVQLVLQEHGQAHDQRPDADHQDVRRRERQQAEQVEQAGRIGGRQVVDPAEERRVPHLDGDEQHLVEREEHRDLDDDRQAARDRVDLLASCRAPSAPGSCEPCRRRTSRAASVIFGCSFFILRHRPVGPVGEREERGLDQQRQDQDGDAVIADHAVDASAGRRRSAWSGSRTSRSRPRGRTAGCRRRRGTGRAASPPWRRRTAGR